MKYLISILISLLFLSGCEDKGYGTQNITNVPSITSNDKVKILSSTPKDILAKKAYISIEFTSYMNIQSLNTSNISLVDANDAVIDLIVDAKNNKLYIEPLSSLVDGVDYTLTIKKSIQDIMGNGLDRDYSHTFTCSSDFWSSVEAGDTHSMALSKAGDIFIWGSNSKKQIVEYTQEELDINSTTLTRNIPLGIINSNATKDYSAGGESSSAVTKDDTLFSVGQFYIAHDKETNLSSVSSGTNHIAFIKLDGTLWSWGKNDNGQLGNFSIFAQVNPVQESSQDTNWTKVSAGMNFSIALKSDNTLWGWGDNTYGQIGDTLFNERRTPQQEDSNATNWADLSAGGMHSVMLKDDGTLWSFGNNDVGQLGTANNTSSNIAVREDTNSTWQKIAAGYNHTCAIKSDNTLWCWGGNRYGQLGINNTINQNTPTKVGTDTNWQTISLGKEYSVATKTDGTLWSWGYNAHSQLGLGSDKDDKLVPTEVK